MTTSNSSLSEYWNSILANHHHHQDLSQQHQQHQPRHGDVSESESTTTTSQSEGEPPKCKIIMIDQDNARTHPCNHPVIRQLHPTQLTSRRRHSFHAAVNVPPIVNKALGRWGNSSTLADSLTAKASPKCILLRNKNNATTSGTPAAGRQQQQEQQPTTSMGTRHLSWEEITIIDDALNVAQIDSASNDCTSILLANCFLPPSSRVVVSTQQQPQDFAMNLPQQQSPTTFAANINNNSLSIPLRLGTPTWGAQAIVIPKAVRVSPLRIPDLRSNC